MGDPKKEKLTGKAKSTASGSNAETEEDVLSLVKTVIIKLEENTKMIKENFETNEFTQGEISDTLAKFAEDFNVLKEEIREVKKENIALRDTVKSLSNKVKDYDNKFEYMERQKKKANISIEGMLEIENLPLEKLMDELLEDLSLKYKAKDVCNKIYRKGKFIAPTAGNMPKTRPVIVQFYDKSFKYEIYNNIKNMVGKDKWRNVYFNNELTADQTNKMKNMRAISGYARSVGMETKIKGTSLIVDGKKFTLDDLDCVPEEITIEKAKNIEINGALIFQGHHSVLSNMSHSDNVFEGKKFESAETAFQFKKAEICNRHEEAKVIQKMVDPYMAKRINKNIKETTEWKQKKEKVMKEILEASPFLVKTGNLKLVEGTNFESPSPNTNH